MATKHHDRISPGDEVQFTLGTSTVHGIVVEDRGPIGAGKVRLFSVRVSYDPYDDDQVFEMPEDEIHTVARSDSTDEAISVNEAVEYLKGGGLIDMLRAGNASEKVQPHAWLRRDSLGNVTHTFSPERGVLGGSTVPYFALYDNRVFSPKRGEVLAFLTSFGLPRKDAEHVIQTVGAAS